MLAVPSHVVPLPTWAAAAQNEGASRGDGPDLKAVAAEIEGLARRQPGPGRRRQPKSRAADLIGPRNTPKRMRSLAPGRTTPPTPSTSKYPPPPLSPFKTPPRLTKVPTSRLPSRSARFSIVPVALGRTRRSGQLACSSAQVTEKRVGGEEPKRRMVVECVSAAGIESEERKQPSRLRRHLAPGGAVWLSCRFVDVVDPERHGAHQHSSAS